MKGGDLMWMIHQESKVRPYLSTDGVRKPSVMLVEKYYPLTPGNYANAFKDDYASNDKDATFA